MSATTINASKASVSPALSYLPSTTTAAETVEALQRDGAVIVQDLLDQATLQELNADFEPHLAANRARLAQGQRAENSILKNNQAITDGLTVKSPAFVSLITHPLPTGVADGVLGPNCVHYQVSGTSINQLEPGAKAQEFHRDDSNWPMPYPRCDMLLITLWALTDFTRENGATRVVPGSHRWDDAKKQLKHQGLYDLLPADFRHPTDDEIAYAEMPAGSCLMLLGSTLHSGGANVSTGQIRRGMYLGYILGWLRTEENHYLTIPVELARTLPEEALRLMGYQMHGGLTGWVGYGVDPIDAIKNGRTAGV